MSDDKDSSDARAPRPYRRLKPPYPDSAAVAEVEATLMCWWILTRVARSAASS